MMFALFVQSESLVDLPAYQGLCSKRMNEKKKKKRVVFPDEEGKGKGALSRVFVSGIVVGSMSNFLRSSGWVTAKIQRF